MSLEFALRDWLRTRPTLMGLLNNEPKRLDLAWDGNLKATHLTLYRAGGPQNAYLPQETAFISIHCYGSTQKAASGLAEQVARELRAMVQEPLNDSAVGQGATVESISWLPAADDTARYVVTTSVTALIAAPAA